MTASLTLPSCEERVSQQVGLWFRKQHDALVAALRLVVQLPGALHAARLIERGPELFDDGRTASRRRCRTRLGWPRRRRVAKMRLEPRQDLRLEFLLDGKHVGAVAGSLVLHERVRWVPRPAERKSHGLHGATIALAGRAEDRQPRGIPYELAAVGGEAAAQEHHGSDLRVASGELHGLVHPAARTCRADARLVDAWLRRQPRVGGVDVSGPFPVGDPLLLLRVVRLRPATLSVAAIVRCQHVEAACGRCRRQTIP